MKLFDKLRKLKKRMDETDYMYKQVCCTDNCDSPARICVSMLLIGVGTDVVANISEN